ncbi:RNA polymerase sigma-70 factor, ECF subfamily [Chitinophaga costaii]|uniref:RNA polymerase sigma-70 factor, ECF subfamily n=1 Tax=Chitinophaga costaii TaxID=1335309 RepID=A0A1C3Z307_9BACT|nr:sigma-70 family RNA polymerase sigma factor [Chitinophaga costaii]PUZ30207.1 sigma-70 family RNA polymerase sigma factor [Chitinophaga costaii]SCB76648.1 RNA polymerase sigma-70 factor, ECF subfamily [Chitinophaga costaii]
MSAVNGYRDQVTSWYSGYYEKFLAMGIKFGLDAETVKDIVNQFFLDLLEKDIDTATIVSPVSYLTTGFKRRLIDHYRASRHTRERLTELPEDYTTNTVSQLEVLQQNEMFVSSVRNAYLQLPDRCRKVIYLKFYQGKTTEQIVEQTGLCKRTVYNNLFEGIKLLRMQLQHVVPEFQLAYLSVLLPLILAQL